jgi:hypothetical protein
MRIDSASDKDMIAALRRQGARGPWLQVLSAVLDIAGQRVEFLRHNERAWSSVTFTGTRHVIGLRFAGEDAVADGEAFIAQLPEHEFTIPRQLVAEAAVTSVDHQFGDNGPVLTLDAELLLLEDC